MAVGIVFGDNVRGDEPTTRSSQGPRYDDKTVQQWLLALKDKDPGVRRDAAKALGSLEPRTRAPVAALRDALTVG